MACTSRLIILCCIYFFLSSSVYSQETNIRIKVVNNKNEPVAFATVTVLSVPDTIHQQSRVSDSAGISEFQLLQGHPYIIRVTSINYEVPEKKVTIKGENPFYLFKAQALSSTLNKVVVTANRPLMRQEDDKTIVDPENLAASSTNAYEIIEKVPGLYVDQDGNIYLNSTTPATVYINGREQKMSAADIATMLKNLPPNAIASIEILRTPSAKYDASGTGGIVNVILKKGVRIGLTGSITGGLNQGKYGNQFIGININNNNGKTSSYLNFQLSRRDNYEEIKTERIFSSDSLLSQDAITTYPTTNYYIGYGINYQFNKKWEISYDGRFSFSNSNNRSNNFSSISKISTAKVISNNEADVINKITNYNITQGFNIKDKIDTTGSEWSTDLSFTYSPNNTDQLFVTRSFIPVYPAVSGDGNLNNKLQFFSAQTNLLKKLPKEITLETGLKTTLVLFTNNTNYYLQSGTERIKDNLRTGAFSYHENINSGYLQASKNMNGIILKAGVRMENTNMSGNQRVPKDTSFTIHRTDLFPYVYLSRNIMRIAGYDLKAYLVYRRTITRPAYEYLNPSARFIDPYLFEAGNPSLRPQFTKNYEANVSVNERPIIAIGLNDTKDIFTQVIYPSDSSKKVSVRTYDNLGNNKEYYFRALGAIPPGKRYFFVVGIQYNHNLYHGQYQNSPLTFDRGSWTTFMYQTFKITPLTQLTLNGFARFNGQLQFYELSSFGSLNISLAQQFLKKKMIITISANDLFFTNNNHFTIHQGTVDATGFRQSDTRRFGLNIRYNFGIRKKEENNILNVESPEKNN